MCGLIAIVFLPDYSSLSSSPSLPFHLRVTSFKPQRKRVQWSKGCDPLNRIVLFKSNYCCFILLQPFPSSLWKELRIKMTLSTKAKTHPSISLSTVSKSAHSFLTKSSIPFNFSRHFYSQRVFFSLPNTRGHKHHHSLTIDTSSNERGAMNVHTRKWGGFFGK